ncbi:hypothetical protein Hanom_Chr08g00696251 [Helianthus anomalus]
MVDLILHLSRCVIGLFSIPNLTLWRGTSSWYSKDLLNLKEIEPARTST